MSGMWKRSHGRASEAPPNERGGHRYVRPTATAPHLDSTDWPAWRRFREMRARTSHAYDAEVALQVAAAIPEFLEEAEHLYAELQRRLA
jgi:nucleotidyltransferase-like protein